jgi:hypothetical protein
MNIIKGAILLIEYFLKFCKDYSVARNLLRISPYRSVLGKITTNILPVLTLEEELQAIDLRLPEALGFSVITQVFIWR